MRNLAGEGENEGLRLDFDSHPRLEFRGTKVTADAALTAVRELDEALGLTVMAGEMMRDARTGNIRHEMTGLMRRSVYARPAACEDVNDQELLLSDPAVRAVMEKKAIKRNAASSQTVAGIDTEILAREESLKAPVNNNHARAGKAMRVTRAAKIILDMDLCESSVHWRREGSACSGHFCPRCYHPLFACNQFGNCEGAHLRPGHVHSADA